MAEPRRAPPLVVWLGVALFYLMAVAALVVEFSARDPLSSPEWTTFQSLRLGHAAARAQRAVVVLGRSTMMEALPLERALGRELSARGGVRVIKVGWPAAVMSDFEALVPALLALRPAVTLMEVPLLFQVRPPAVRWELFPRWLDWRLRGEGPWRPREHDLQWGITRFRECGWSVRPDADTLESQWRGLRALMRGRLQKDSAGAPLGEALALLRALKAQGGIAALLHVPAHPRYEAEYGLVGRPEPERHLRSLEGEGIPVWRPDDPPPAEEYCDYLHLHSSGRKRYGRWLASRLEEALRAGPGGGPP